MNTYLLAYLHDSGYPCNEISSLLSHFGCLVVQSPQHCSTYLGQIWLHPLPQCSHYGPESIQNHNVLRRLLLKFNSYFYYTASDTLIGVDYKKSRQNTNYFSINFLSSFTYFKTQLQFFCYFQVKFVKLGFVLKLRFCKNTFCSQTTIASSPSFFNRNSV